ncbi:MAG TPA: T9SS type A sorting domain-containing protein [Bacteroidia bacterium]|nr:T9SS type A sorting domain-containing protein [Bacteroidia bacterium]
MKHAILVLAGMYILNTVSAQVPYSFYVTFGGKGDDVAHACKQTLDGGYIIAGSSTSTGFGQNDLYLIKMDSLGQMSWEKFIGGFGIEVGHSVLQLPDSGYVCCGYTNSFGFGGYDLYLVRTDKTGALLWQKTFGGTDWDFGNDVLLTADGNLLCVGYSYSNGLGKKDAYAVKCDLQGNLVWQKHYGGTEDEELRRVFTKDGNIFYTCGYTCSFGELNGDMYALKLNSSGDTLFTIRYGQQDRDVANSIIVDANDSIFLAGGLTYTNMGSQAAYAKFNQTPSHLWTRHYGMNNEDEEAFKIIASAHPLVGSYISVYTTQEVPGYKKDTKTIYMNSSAEYYGGPNSGAFGFPQDDEIFDISATKDKGYISCGYTSSFGSGDKDVLIIKRDSVLFWGNSIVGLSEQQSGPAYQSGVYPNPVQAGKKLYYISSSPSNEPFSARVCDLSGREYEIRCGDEDGSIDVSGLEQGFYLLSLEKAGKRELFRLLVQN